MKDMRPYKIKTTANSMIIINRETGEQLAEYLQTPGNERAEADQMRRSLNRHLDNPGATLGNYQW